MQRFVQTPAVALYTGLSTTATTMRITPYPVDLDGTKLTITDFGATPSCTIDPKVSGFEEIVTFTGITDNLDGTATLTGLVRDLTSKYPYTTPGTGKLHGSSAVVVFSDNPQMYGRLASKENDETITGQWTFNSFPITPSTPLASAAVYGMTRLSVAPASPTAPIAVGVNDTTTFAALTAGMPTAAEIAYAGITVPSGWLSSDGSAVSRITWANLWAALSRSATFTVTIAAPGVFTSTAHGLTAGMRVRLTTTGGLPSGLTAITTDYYVISTGLTANAFQLSATPGGTGITTTGTQSGTHTFTYAPHGHGDGSTTFTLPDRRGRGIIGAGTGVKTVTILSVAGNVITGNLSVANNNEFQTGQAIVFTATVAGNLVTSTTYYVIRTGNNTFSVATNLVNAQAGTAIALAGTETGSFALTLSTRTLGDTGGEENHSQSSTELAAHVHTSGTATGTVTSGSPFAGSNGSVSGSQSVGSSGSNTPANIMQPFGVDQFIIKT
jgi:microcystin-dependent protein